MNDAPKGDPSFLKQIVLVSAAAVVLGAYPVSVYATEEIARGIVAGGLLSVINVLMGYAVVRFSAGKNYAAFMQIVMGGIVVRLFVMVGLLLIAVGLLKFHAFALIGSLFVMYIVFLAVEVMFIHNNFQHP